MKTVTHINLAGVIFAIDEKAQRELSSYLKGIETYFSSNNQTKESSHEIVSDIESSVAEKFLQKKNHYHQQKEFSVTEKDVKKAISELGTVEELFANEDSLLADSLVYTEKKEGWEKRTSRQKKRLGKNRKRLYRDGENNILGGVASGIAYYFNIDPLIVRSLFFVTMFLGGFGFWAYIFLWIVVPKAKTSSQKLEMEGKKASLQTIKKKIIEDSTSHSKWINLKNKESKR